MEQLLKLLNGIAPLSQPLRSHLKRKIRIRKFKKGTTILALGEICDSILFIEKGLVRSYYLLDGEEVSNWFMKEGDIFVSVLSFFRRKPTVDALVAVEDCVCWGITFDELEEMRRKYVDCWLEQACPPFVRISSQDMMRRSKIIARRSYYKYLRDLHRFGLIEYRPEYYPGKTSLVGMNLISSRNDNFVPSVLLNHIRMDNKKRDDKRSVFELNDQEAAAQFQLVADNIRKELFAKGLPITYQDDRCTGDDLFIQEYEDGRIYLVRLDVANQSYTLVKDLGNA